MSFHVSNFMLKSLFILILSFSFGCSNLVQSPTIVSIDNPDIKDIDKDKFSFTSDIKIFNPNWFALTASDLDYNIYYDSLLLGKGKFVGEVNIKKQDSTIIHNSTKILKESIKRLVDIKDTVTLNIIGSAIIPYINYRYYYDIDYKTDIKEIFDSITKSLLGEIKVEIDKVNITSFNVISTNLEIDFKINSDIDFDYKIKKLKINIYKDKDYNLLGTSEISKEYLIKKDTINKFQSNVEINNIKMGSVFLSNIVNNDLTLSLEINSVVEYSEIILPISTKRKIKFNPKTSEIKVL